MTLKASAAPIASTSGGAVGVADDRSRRGLCVAAPSAGWAVGTGLRAMRFDGWNPPTAQEKLFNASASVSNVSNTVSSFVIDSESLMRLVTFSSFSAPPFLLTVAYD